MIKTKFNWINSLSAFNVQSSESSVRFSITQNFNSHLNIVWFQNFIKSSFVQKIFLFQSWELIKLTQINSFNKIWSLTIIREQPNLVQLGALIISDGVILTWKKNFINWSCIILWWIRNCILFRIIVFNSLLECFSWHVENFATNEKFLSLNFGYNK